MAKIVLAALIGALWAGRRLRHTYFYFDEWSMIGRVTQLGKLEGATTSFNGHLWFFQDLIFRVQANWFGLDSNTFLVVVFVVALVALHMSLTALARGVGVPLVPALALGGLLTYLGAAAQNFVFAIQVSPTFATAAAVGAAAIALGGPPTAARFVAVSGLLLLAALFDSGVGLLALALGGGVVVGLWPRQSWWSLAPAGLITAIWYGFGDLGPEFEASVSDRVVFAARLLGRGAGAIAGGAAATGFVVLVVLTAATLVAMRAGRIDRAGWSVMLAGGLATLINIAGIAQSRAGLPGFTFFENNRYLQNVALPLTIAALPGLLASAQLAKERWKPLRRAAPPVRHALPVLAMAVCFALGLGEESTYSEVLIDRSERVAGGVQDIGTVLLRGCPTGTAPSLDTRPLGGLSPQVSARLVGELVRRDLLTIEERLVGSVDYEILRSICPS